MHCCASHLCSQEGDETLVMYDEKRPHTTGKLSHTRTLRADRPSEQQVHSKVSLRRAVDAVSGVEWGAFEPAIKGKRHDGQAACEPGAGGCGGVPVHPVRLHTHRTSPAQALLTTLTETC
jgi:hypothetical protein